MALTERGRILHGTDPTMGSPRITAESNDTPQEGDGQVDHKQVDRLMRAAGTRRPTGDGAGCAPPGPGPCQVPRPV